jgi:redox-sensitive bicupin YhaK (pirin superfamily)
VKRSIRSIIPAKKKPLGDNMSVDSPLPSPFVRQISPFLMLDHFGPHEVSPDHGFYVPPHPHRGFEPVTILFEGAIEHHDSAGNRAAITGGGVQWMTADSGLVHSEQAVESFAKAGGTIHGIQLWVNLPRDKKMTPPKYQNISSESIPVIESLSVKLRIISGEIDGIVGPAKTFTPVLAIHGIVSAGGSKTIEVPSSFNAFVYVTRGTLLLNGGERADAKHLVWLSNDGDEFDVSASSDGEFLLLAGEPIDEPVASYGPFVMNEPAEIMQAVEDYQSGAMGYLEN